MKKAVTLVLVGILIGLAGAYVYFSTKDTALRKNNEALRVEIAVVKAVLEGLEKTSLARIEELTEQVGGLQGNIDSLMFVNAQLEEDAERLRKEAAALEIETAALKEEVQPVIDANPRLRAFVDSIMAQVAKEKDYGFTLAKRCATLEESFANSEKKSLLLMEEVDIYKGLWTKEKELRQKVELRLNLQDKRVVSLERRIKLTNVAGGIAVVAALAAILIH